MNQKVLLAIFRVGYTWRTHKHLMNKTKLDQCITCDIEITVKHVLLNAGSLMKKKTETNLSIIISPNV